MKTFTKSTAFFMALAVFAMIFTGCSKDSSSSNNNGGGGSNPPLGNYGTIMVGDNEYTIRIGAYEVDYNEDIDANILVIGMADGIGDDANVFEVAFPYQSEMVVGSFNFSTEDPMPAGKCGGIFTSGDNSLICMSGSISIQHLNNSKYKIDAEGVANIPLGSANSAMGFSVDFEGTLTEEN